ncbi:unnamed protein product [Rotaria socialis]|uniref:Uncharacterized protein n=2 Tax=Rotaria socialis TaxID=392032 RepID=A0A817SN05_9BILA|nr:unnamed protein product [Rotaria socialis]
MRKARYLLDRNLKDKFIAQSIDEHSLDLNLINPSLYLQEEKDDETKANAIFVDEVECHEGLRKSISVENW